MSEDKHDDIPAVMLTELQIHNTTHRQHQSWFQQIYRSLKSGKPKRIYGKAIGIKERDGSTKILLISPSGSDILQENGQRIRMLLPKSATISPGPDVIEQIKAIPNKKRKRYWKKLRGYIR